MRYRIGVASRSVFTHANLVLCETLLVANVLKEEVVALVIGSTWDNRLKVLFAMALVVGFLGGFFVLVQRLTRNAVGKAHGAAAGRGMDRWLVHAALLGGLYLLYARRLHLPLF